PQAVPENIRKLQDKGVEVFQCSGEQSEADGIHPSPGGVLAELGRRQMTNVLVEGGSELLGTVFDQHLVDEVHVFAAPKLLGGTAAKSPVGGTGRADPSDLPDIIVTQVELLGGCVNIIGAYRTL